MTFARGLVSLLGKFHSSKKLIINLKSCSYIVFIGIYDACKQYSFIGFAQYKSD